MKFGDWVWVICTGVTAGANLEWWAIRPVWYALNEKARQRRVTFRQL